MHGSFLADLMRTRTSHRWFFLLPLVLTMAGTAAGQAPEGIPADWKKTETAAETEYKQPLAEGGAADAKIRGFLRDKALPQLALESNRTTIEKTRRRMRDFLLGGIEDAKAFDDVSRVVLDFMATVARDGDADPVVRVNAMLLVGELRAKDNKQPWAPAVPVLAAGVADAKLPAEVRIAAVVGLARHLEMAKAPGSESPDAKAVLDALTLVVTSPADPMDPAAMNWLLSRALTALPAATPTLPKAVAAAVVKILEDSNRPFDVRVRAAAALGTAAKPDSGIDAAKTVATIQSLARAALARDLELVAQQRAEENFGTTLATDTNPPKEESRNRTAMAELASAMAELACRRNAWRLVTLADAVASEDGSAGLATLLGKAGGAALELAKTLRSQGLAIDADPTEDAVAAAAEALGGTATPVGTAAAPNASPVQPSPQPAAKPDSPAEAVNPFAK